MNLFKREDIRNAREIVQGGHIAWYVGRPSPLGNPYRVEAESQRDEAIVKYKEHLMLRAAEAAYGCRSKVTDELNILIRTIEAAQKDVYILCWCPSNKGCHCDVLCELLNSRTNRELLKYSGEDDETI